MRRLLYLLILVVVFAVGYWGGVLVHDQIHKTIHSKPNVVSQSQPSPKTVSSTSYRVGDTQNIGDMNITLDRVQSVNPTTFEVDISTDYASPLDTQFIPKGAWIFTSDGQYRHSSSVNGTQIYFTIPSNVYVDTFIFYNFKWYL